MRGMQFEKVHDSGLMALIFINLIVIYHCIKQGGKYEQEEKMASITSAGLVFAMLLSQSAVADLGTEQVKAAENTAKWVDTEYVVNGDFESSINGDGSITGWTKSTGSGLFVTKDEWAKNNTTQFTKIKDITGDNSLSQTIKNVEPGTYRISIDQDGQKMLNQVCM